MALLLDTHVLLWATGEPARLSPKIRDLIDAPASVVYVSMATVWELGIKANLGRLALPEGYFRSLPEIGYRLLAVEVPHVEAYRMLPSYHRDPFDRMLIAQAQVEGLTLVTNDREIERYGVRMMAA